MFPEKKVFNFTSLVALILVASLIVSCAQPPRAPQSQMDTPEHHTFTGLRLLNQEKYAEAQKAFELALQLNPKFSKAHTGIALVKTFTGDFNAAMERLQTGWKHAKTDDEKIFVHVSRIRFHTQSKLDKNWLQKAKDEFDDAVQMDSKHSPAYYFMGLAYKSALEFNSAEQMFGKVIDLKSDFVKEADVQWELMQRIKRAMPGSINGKRIAIVDKINRADAAALFMEELKIEVLYKKRTPKTFDTSFREPGKTGDKPATVKAKDIANHPLRVDIEGIIEIGLRGLEVYPDGNYYPNEFVTRAAYAMMLEDILIKVTGDNSLATRFIGTKSPFPDLRADLPYFNAVMVVTSRGIMRASDLTTGEFAPLSTVRGVDALLIIRRIKEELKFD